MSLVLVPIVLGVAVYMLPPAVARVVAALGEVGLVAWAVIVLARGVASGSGELVQPLGTTGSALVPVLRADVPALALTLASTVICAAALALTLRWRRGQAHHGAVTLLLLAFQGLAAGLFVADDLFTAFVLFEVSTIVTVVLLVADPRRRNLYDALYYLVVQVVGMLFFLFGLAYLYRSYGVLSLADTAAAVAATSDPRALVLPCALMLTGLGVKAGLFPLYGYVPRSYPSPGAPDVVPLLASGVLVTGALFWLTRLVALFSPVLELGPLLAAVGLVTALAGAAKALATRDLRLVLAYSTVSQAGFVVLGLAGLSASSGFDTVPADLYVLGHALAKSALFAVVMCVGRMGGTFDVGAVRGLWRRAPWAAGAAVLAMASMAGLPLTVGGVTKGLLSNGGGGWLSVTVSVTVSVALAVAGWATMLVCLRFARILRGESDGAPERARALGPTILAVILAAACLAPIAWLTGTHDISGWLGSLTAWVVQLALADAVVWVARRYGAGALAGAGARLRRTHDVPHAVLAAVGFFAVVVAYATAVA